MIRAVLRNGVVQPLDPLPAYWADGRELRIEEVGMPELSLDEFEKWNREVEAIIAQMTPAGASPHDMIMAQMHAEGKVGLRFAFKLSEERARRAQLASRESNAEL